MTGIAEGKVLVEADLYTELIEVKGLLNTLINDLHEKEYTVQQAADLMNKSVRTLYSLMKNGELVYSDGRGGRRISRSDIKSYLHKIKSSTILK